MKGNKDAIHSVKRQAGRSALLKLSWGNSALLELNFSANFKKCAFAMSKVKYVGHFCWFRGTYSQPRKNIDLQEVESPKRKKALVYFGSF